MNKIDNIRNELKSILAKYKTKSCEFDCIPASIFKLCVSELVPIGLRIMNISLTTGYVPDDSKNALVRPLLKKLSLDHVLSNNRPVSSFPYISKILGHAVNIQLSIYEHFVWNYLSYSPHIQTTATRKRHC